MTMPEATDFRRYRRMRATEGLRRIVRETVLQPADFVYPMFITHGRGVRNEISSMPDVFQLSTDQLSGEVEDLHELGIGSVLLFGIPETKDHLGTDAYHAHGIVQEAIRELKRLNPDLVVIGDVCMCEYTDHGHCGILNGEEIDNDATLEYLARTAVAQAEAGVDVVAPSDMMDGRVQAMRQALDAAGYRNLPIISYAAKYASGYYGPFREAAESTPTFGDRRSHQMDPANAREAYLEIAADIDEGADAIIVKPALAYLDIVSGARQRFDVPILAYNVSGEYSMIKAAGRLGWIDEKRVTLESLTAIKRAGAGQIITYHAKEAARWLAEDGVAERVAIKASMPADD
jgi:porphobilinogen synthase